mgnify:CR=1 FL=1
MSRNRTAIESELSSLYDAYYDELESYALHQQRYASLPPGTIPPPPGPGPFPGSVDASAIPPTPPADPNAAAATAKAQRGRVVKPTRDHKNVRPAAKKAAPPPAKPPTAAAVPPVPPVPAAGHHTHGHTHAHHGHTHANPGHGEPGHTHSPSCPHHPHHHGAAGNGNNDRQKNKAAVVHPEEPDEDEFDDDEEGEYDEDDEEDGDEDGEGEYDDDEEDEEEVRLFVSPLGLSPTPDESDRCFPRPRLHSRVQYDDEDSLAPEDQPAPTRKSRRGGADGEGDFFGFGRSLTVKGQPSPLVLSLLETCHLS